LAIGLWVPKINLGPSPISFLSFSFFLFFFHTQAFVLCTQGADFTKMPMSFVDFSKLKFLSFHPFFLVPHLFFSFMAGAISIPSRHLLSSQFFSSFHLFWFCRGGGDFGTQLGTGSSPATETASVRRTAEVDRAGTSWDRARALCSPRWRRRGSVEEERR
jgi:hypothetical protein